MKSVRMRILLLVSTSVALLVVFTLCADYPFKWLHQPSSSPLVSAAAQQPPCAILVYDDTYLKGVSYEFKGPIELGALGKVGGNWKDRISSIRVGTAELQVWEKENYKGSAMAFGPNSFIYALGQMDNKIESLKIICR